MSAATNPPASGAPVEEPAPEAGPGRWAHEVIVLLTAALARDDQRRRRPPKHCPNCGGPLLQARS